VGTRVWWMGEFGLSGIRLRPASGVAGGARDGWARTLVVGLRVGHGAIRSNQAEAQKRCSLRGG